MISSRFAILSSLLFSVLLIGPACSKAKSTPPPEQPTVKKGDRTFNDAARFLAGMPSVAGSSYAELEKDPAWQEYSKGLGASWNRADEKLIAPVRTFQKRELANPKSRFLFYPFSGPDVVYAQAFFPGAKVMFMAGLEPPGSIVPASAYNAENLPTQLANVKKSAASLFERSFFVTGEMDRMMRGQLIEGVLPVTLLLMARSGNEIDHVRFVNIEADGSLTEIPKANPKRSAKPEGFELTFHREGEKEERTVHYFRWDLAKGVEEYPGFLTFVKKLGRSETLIKSASFLLHWGSFNTLRAFILENSERITQDDTGIMYNTFLKQGWKIKLYGSYHMPDRPFTKEFQKDMLEAYGQPGVGELGFSIGYGASRRPSNMQIAEKPEK